MAALAEYILASDPKSVVSSKKERKYDGNLKSKKREKAIAQCIQQPPKSPLHNEDKVYEYKEEDDSAPLD